jgi:hypothetical protein
VGGGPAPINVLVSRAGHSKDYRSEALMSPLQLLTLKPSNFPTIVAFCPELPQLGEHKSLFLSKEQEDITPYPPFQYDLGLVNRELGINPGQDHPSRPSDEPFSEGEFS